MSKPNLGSTAAPAYASTLFDGQAASGNTDITVTTNKTWALKSLTLCNVTASAVTVGVQVKPSGGATFRAVVNNYTLASNAAGDGTNSLSLDSGKHLPGLLADGAVIRITSSAATSVDYLGTGTELG